MIPGYLITNSKVTAKNKNNKSMKKFVPYDHNQEPFYVPTRLQFKVENTLCCVNSEKKQLLNTLGMVGNYQDEYTFLKYCYNLIWKKFDNNIFLKYIDTDIYSNIRKDFTHLETFSIDPVGCKDIDDAISIETINNGYKVYVHIADVASYIPINSVLDKIIQQRCSSMYLTKLKNDKTNYQDQINMLPDELVTNYCSLTHNTFRRCSTLIMTIKDNKVMDYEFCKSNIINNNAISYEAASELLETNENLKLLFNLGKEIYNNDDGFQKLEDYDTHKMIEIFMVLANNLAAVKLSEKCSNVCLLRVCDTTSDLNINYLFQKVGKAKYIIGTKNNTGHKGLNLEYYTHFTSPIRRYADIIVHRLLFDSYDYNNYNIDVDNINDTVARIKKLERDTIALAKIYNIYDQIKNKGSSANMIGSVLKIEENKLLIFVKELNFIINIKLFHSDIKEVLYKFIINEDKTNVLILKKEDNSLVSSFSINEEININVIVSLKQNRLKDKIIIKICKLDFII
mgnify:CR=1 FL=1